MDDDVDNIDFNNYKGIYADDDAGQKYTCPLTGAHFEPRDLCRRVYEVVQKRKPHEMELYGQNMLVDGVGSSLLAEAPFADSNTMPRKRAHSGAPQGAKMQEKPRVQNSNYQPPNARAGSMKQPEQKVTQASYGNSRQVTQGDQPPKHMRNMVSEAYDAPKEVMTMDQMKVNSKKRTTGSVGIQQRQSDSIGNDFSQKLLAGAKKAVDASSSMMSEKTDQLRQHSR